jgi:hypothetical protein
VRRGFAWRRKGNSFAAVQLAHRAEESCRRGLALPSHSMLGENAGSVLERKVKDKRPCCASSAA